MTASEKLNKLLATTRDPREVQDWLFSLTPLGVAFTFFLIFLWPLEIPNKDVIFVVGLAAGFVGLESYWVSRGWRRNHISTVLLGLIGIAITLALAIWYVRAA